MAGSHRAPRRQQPRAPRSSAVPAWAIVVAVVAALVPATVLTAHRVIDSDDAPSSRSTDLPIPPVTPKASRLPSKEPAPTRTTAPAARLARVAPDAPRRITSGDLIDSGFDNAVPEIEPASETEVTRWEGRGSPGSPGTDTVYVIGQVNGDDSAFGNLSKVKPGARIRITTDNGVLTYTVRAATLRDEDGLAQSPLFRTHRTGRLVLVGIRYDDSGNRLEAALVVTAQLSAAKKS